MTTLSVDVDIDPSEDLFGKSVDDLQDNIIIGSGHIVGTLKHVTNYTGFSSNVNEQSGHYLALHCEVPDEDDVTIKVTGAKEYTLDSDGLIVLIVKKNTGVIKVTASKEGYESVTKTFGLNNLVLE